MNKVILVLLDGLNDQTATEKMGYMHHLVEMKMASKHTISCELPAMSRPLYETVMTGTPPAVHGILNNYIVRNSKEKNIFGMAIDNNLTTAAAAYSWISELYNVAPFNHEKHRIQNDIKRNIQHGSFYWEDEYPDSHLFMDAVYLIDQYEPDFLLLHPMNIDFIGHKYGSSSKRYKEASITSDILLSTVLPNWLSKGYQIIVTADHGMDEQGIHCGPSRLERNVPLWLIGDAFVVENSTEPVSQLIIAPLICRLLGITPAEKMLALESQSVISIR